MNMWSTKPVLGLIMILCLIVSAMAILRHNEKEKEAMTASLNHQIKMFDRMDVEGWKSDLSPTAVIEGLGEKYTVANLGDYFKKMGTTKLKSKITAPFSITDFHAVFARTISGATKDGCTFSQTNVVTLVKFDKQLKIVDWHDMWEEIESIKVCTKDEL